MYDVKLLSEFYRTYNSDPFVNELGAAKEGDLLQQFTNLKVAIDNEKKVFESLKNQMTKISNLFDLPTRMGLSSSINTVIDDLKNTQDSLETYISDQSNQSEVENNIDKFSASFHTFNDIFGKAYESFGETLYFAFKDGAISLDDLEDMKNVENMPEHQRDLIQAIMERIKFELEPVHTDDVNMAEQTAVKDEKGEKTSNTDNGSTEVTKQDLPKPTLKEKLDNIEYENGVNYAEEVTLVRTEAELEKLAVQIERLQAKDKLSFSEAIELQTLLTQSLSLQEMVFSQSKKQEKRERQMANLDDKIDLNAEKLAQERQKGDKSRLFRYMSARKQKKLQDKLKELEGKMTIIQKEQRMSTLLKFDKANNKLARKAKRQATRQVIMTTTRENVRKLKAFGRKVINTGKATYQEGKNLLGDVKRYVHNSALMEKLRGQEIVMTGTPEVLLLPEETTKVASM